jgi:hypothetical protein
MNILYVFRGSCNCDVHLGDEVKQVTVQLDDGRIAVAQDDGRGAHYWIGNGNGIGTMRQALPWEEGEIIKAVRGEK